MTVNYTIDIHTTKSNYAGYGSVSSSPINFLAGNGYKRNKTYLITRKGKGLKFWRHAGTGYKRDDISSIKDVLTGNNLYKSLLSAGVTMEDIESQNQSRLKTVKEIFNKFGLQRYGTACIIDKEIPEDILKELESLILAKQL